MDLWQYVLYVNPFATKDDVEEIRELNDWDLLIIFKDGQRVLYDRCTGYFKNVHYNDITELTEEQEKKEFAYMLRSMMKRRFITQDQLAEKAHLTQTMISRYVRGDAMPSASVLNKIAKVLRCSMDDFFNKNY